MSSPTHPQMAWEGKAHLVHTAFQKLPYVYIWFCSTDPWQCSKSKTWHIVKMECSVNGQIAVYWHTGFSDATREQQGLQNNTQTFWELRFLLLNSCQTSEPGSSRQSLLSSRLLFPHPFVTPSTLVFSELLPMWAAAAPLTMAVTLQQVLPAQTSNAQVQYWAQPLIQRCGSYSNLLNLYFNLLF